MVAVVIHREIVGRTAYDAASISAYRRSPDLLPMRRLVALDVGAVLSAYSVSFYTRPTTVLRGLGGEAGRADGEGHAAVLSTCLAALFREIFIHSSSSHSVCWAAACHSARSRSLTIFEKSTS